MFGRFFDCECNNEALSYSAVVILGALGVAIYFIVDDAIDKKVKACLTKHFDNQRLFTAYNITAPEDLATITYSAEDCDSIVQKGYEKTRRKIDELPFEACVKNAFKNKPFLDTIMLWAVLQKEGHNATAILRGAATKAGYACEATKTQVN